MKVERTESFKPVRVTLETQEEVDILSDYLGAVADGPSGVNQNQGVLLIDRLFDEVAESASEDGSWRNRWFDEDLPGK